MNSTVQKSLGIVLVIAGLILFFMVCAEFILRIVLGIAALYIINMGLELQGSNSLPVFITVWTNKAWGTRGRSEK